MEFPSDQPLDAAHFTATVTALTAVFGDPTRRAIYLYLREHQGATVAQLADACSVHANVVRHHLAILLRSGHVQETEHRVGAVGRPSKLFLVTDDTLDVASLGRRDFLLVALLSRALEVLGPDVADQLATEVGETYGRTLAGNMNPEQRSLSVAEGLHAVAGALTALGFEAHVDEDEQTLVKDNCPFGRAAQDHPVLCAVDRGLVAGLWEGLGVAPRHPVALSSRPTGDDTCRTSFRNH